MKWIASIVTCAALMWPSLASAQVGTTGSLYLPGAGGTLIGIVTADSPGYGSITFYEFVTIEGLVTPVDIVMNLFTSNTSVTVTYNDGTSWMVYSCTLGGCDMQQESGPDEGDGWSLYADGPQQAIGGMLDDDPFSHVSAPNLNHY